MFGSQSHTHTFVESIIDLYSSVIHRADYRRILAEEATRLGAEVRFGCHVVSVDCQSAQVGLADGTAIKGDVVIGADGMYISSLPS